MSIVAWFSKGGDIETSIVVWFSKGGDIGRSIVGIVFQRKTYLVRKKLI
jgi:hypothetical protein